MLASPWACGLHGEPAAHVPDMRRASDKSRRLLPLGGAPRGVVVVGLPVVRTQLLPAGRLRRGGRAHALARLVLLLLRLLLLVITVTTPAATIPLAVLLLRRLLGSRIPGVLRRPLVLLLLRLGLLRLVRALVGRKALVGLLLGGLRAVPVRLLPRLLQLGVALRRAIGGGGALLGRSAKGHAVAAGVGRRVRGLLLLLVVRVVVGRRRRRQHWVGGVVHLNA